MTREKHIWTRSRLYFARHELARKGVLTGVLSGVLTCELTGELARKGALTGLAVKTRIIRVWGWIPFAKVDECPSVPPPPRKSYGALNCLWDLVDSKSFNDEFLLYLNCIANGPTDQRTEGSTNGRACPFIDSGWCIILPQNKKTRVLVINHLCHLLAMTG